MRLTLRTLLAYLDDILEPADARDLGQKIEESEFASGLVHRIRSVTRKLRLGAPKLSGKGMGLDANTVAEYLDNTLPQDRVPDFEKVCLESDVHLAEVASCHQILTLVLGEPADVDPALRERIRGMQARLAAEDDESPESPPVAAPAAELESPPIDHREAEQEDWEDAPESPTIAPSMATKPRPSSIRLWHIAATLVVAFLLALVALIAMGPLDSSHPVLGRLLADSSGDVDSDAKPADDSGQQVTKDADSSQAKVSKSSTTADDSNDSGAAKPGAAGAPSVPAKSDESTFPAAPSDTTTPPGSGEAEPETGEDPGMAEPGAETSSGTGTAETRAGTDAKETGEEVEPRAPAPVALCTSSLHVLARFDPTTETWLRLPANESIPPEEELVALPSYRPQIVFSTGVHLMLVGPAAVSLGEPGADGVPRLLVRYGRILITADGKPDAALDVEMGDRVSRVTLPNLDSSLALDVQRYFEPGTDPEETPAHWLIQALATAGNVTWRDEGAEEAVALSAGQLASMIGTQAPQLSDSVPPPDWLDAKSLRPIDRDASETLEPLLVLNRSLTTSLLEQASNRLVEVRSLAVRSLCALGVYDSFLIDALNAKTYRTFWPDLLLALRISVAQDLESATRIRTTFERLRGDEGAKLFRFLRGYSPEQLADGGAAALVEALASPSMDVRVLAYDNLYRIVEKTNAYQPELDPSRQRRAILNWQRDLTEGEIRYKTPPFEVGE